MTKLRDATDGLLIAAKHARDRADRMDRQIRAHEAVARAEVARIRATARLLEKAANELAQEARNGLG